MAKPRDLRGTKKEAELFEILAENSSMEDGLTSWGTTDMKMTRTKLIKLLARKKSGPPIYQPTDIIRITEGQYNNVITADTTVGIFIFNKLLLEDLEHFGYVNMPMNGKTLSKLEEGMTYLMFEKILSPLKVHKYIDRLEWLLGGPLSHFLNPSLDKTIMKLPDSTRKLREELFTKYHDELVNKGDTVLMAKLERQLTDHALREMRKTDSPALAFFDSGCGIDPYNNFKTIFISKGPVLDNSDLTKTKFNIVLSNYDDGISVFDMPSNNDSLVTGAYEKGQSTGISGYYTKKYNSMYMHVELSDAGHDCGTKKYIEVMITEQNMKAIGKYHYIMENGKPKLLNPMTVKDYLGKTVKLRSAAMCEYEHPRFCNICYGDMPYRLGKTSVGNTFADIPNDRMNASMKKFHDTTIKLRIVEDSEFDRFINMK